MSIGFRKTTPEESRAVRSGSGDIPDKPYTWVSNGKCVLHAIINAL
jgi:hypothetical protein